MKVQNSQGKVFYGLHFYPGVAEYKPQDAPPFRIFINEDTIRNMSPSFQGRPVFVEHVDEVEENINELRKESDGWVVEAFFNKADGKNWVKFIVVSDRAVRAIQAGYKLSNAYLAKSYGQGGTWNGVSYEKEIKDAEYEHLAIVKKPRYGESVIMTPEQFKAYNEQKEAELERITNSKDDNRTSKKSILEIIFKNNKNKKTIISEEKNTMFKFFKKEKVENSTDLESLSVTLPKSGIEKTITQIINQADEIEMKKDEPQVANGDHLVSLGEEKMSVNALVEAYKSCRNELADLKKKASEKPEKEKEENATDSEDKAVKKKALEIAEHEDKEMKEKNEAEDEKQNEVKEDEDKKQNSIEKKKNFEKLQNAHTRVVQDIQIVETSSDMVARGKKLY